MGEAAVPSPAVAAPAWREVSHTPEPSDDELRRLYGAAYRVAYRICGSRAIAEDAALEASYRLVVHWRRVASYAEAWIGRVAANAVLTDLRRRGRVAALDGDRAVDPALDERLALQAALATLPRRQREVVVLRYIADQSEESVAGALRISTGAVKQHAWRGLARLRERLGAEHDRA